MAGCTPVPSEELSTASNPVSSNVHENVKKYYGQYLESSESLKTSAASCSLGCRPTPKSVVDALSFVHPEVTQRFFGCGLPVPEKLEGCKILDLGSGSGRDCFSLSKLVGEEGHVTGIDMTKELVDISRRYIEYHQKKSSYINPNITFVQGYMEKLSEAGIQNDSLDIVVSNCVICLCPNKRVVLQEAFKVLKEGGELYFSDMYASKVIPDYFKQDPVLWGEGMGGSLFWLDFIMLAQEVGFSTPRLVSASHIVIHNCELKAKTGDISYVSATYRLFKIPKTQVMSKAAVTYKGTVADFPDEIEFDSSHIFKKDVTVNVDWEMAVFLRCSRFYPDFSIQTSDEPWVNPSSTAQYCHLNPFLLAGKLGSSVSQCSKMN